MKRFIKFLIILVVIYLIIGIIFASYNYFFGGYEDLISITKGDAFKIDIIGWPLRFLD